MGKNKPFWEIFIGVMIVLGLVLVFLEDICRLGGWSVSARQTLVILGFVVDLVFSVEFVIRSVINGKNRTFKTWFGKERGWIDLLSSWPLLLFVSGPIVMSMLFGGSSGVGFMSMAGLLRTSRVFRMSRVLRVFRVFRVLRFLRLLRLVKFAGVQKAVANANPDDAVEKAKAETLEVKASIMVMVILSFVAVLMISPFVPGIFFSPDQPLADQQKVYSGILQDWYQSMYQDDMARLEHLKIRLADDPNVLYVFNGGATLVNNLTTEELPSAYLPKHWFYTDYKILTFQGMKLYYSTRQVEAMNAKVNLLLETIVVFQILVLMIFYKRKEETA